MPIPVTCTHCGAHAQLADGWPHPGFTCPACRRACPMPPPPGPGTDFAFEDSPQRTAPYRTYGPAPAPQQQSPFAAGVSAGSGCVLGAFATLFFLCLAMMWICAGGLRRMEQQPF